MTRISEVAKGYLIFFCGYYLYIIMVVNALTGQTALSILMLIGFLLPSFMIVYWHIKYKKNKRTPP